MAKRRLNQYVGRLSPAQIAEGMNAARENAARLRADAEALLKGGRHASAAALAVLAIEESGKQAVLRELAVARSDSERAATWRRYRTHTAKNNLAFFLDQVGSGARALEGFRPLFDPDSDLPSLAENVKQVALYTDCLGRKHWSRPTVVISEDLARSLVRAALVLTPEKADITAREIELWQAHLGPVWSGPMQKMKAALVAWHEAMIAEGLEDSARAGEMESFAFGLHAPRRSGGE